MQDPMTLDTLRVQYPDWRITEHWIGSASGPDFYYLHAERSGEDVNASSPAEMARRLRSATEDDPEYLACDVLHDHPEHVFTVRRVLRHYRDGDMSKGVALTQLRGVMS